MHHQNDNLCPKTPDPKLLIDKEEIVDKLIIADNVAVREGFGWLVTLNFLEITGEVRLMADTIERILFCTVK